MRFWRRYTDNAYGCRKYIPVFVMCNIIYFIYDYTDFCKNNNNNNNNNNLDITEFIKHIFLYPVTRLVGQLELDIS